MINKYHIAVSTVLTTILIGCGGGGGGDSTSTTQTTATSITGTVPGTLIEAFCTDGSYYQTNSIKTGNQHPFELELPDNIDCRLVMTTNENDPNPANRIITPIKFNNNTYIALKNNIDIGYIDLSVTGKGIQTPLNINISFDETQIQLKELSIDPLDIDKDGIPNVYEDDDSDGIANKLDVDNKTAVNDLDGDGIDDDHDKDIDNDGVIDMTQVLPVLLPTTFNINDGRLLASSCFQCHGTNGKSVNSWDSLSASEMNEMIGEHPLMDAIGIGYTNDEILKMTDWLRTIPNSTNSENKGDDND